MSKITPDQWGPPGWKFIHIVAFAYPLNPTQEEKNNYKAFFTLIGDILPCHLCSEHYKKNLILHPLTDTILENKINLTLWTIDMHNEVNKINNKTVYDYETALQLIKSNFEIKEKIVDKINKETFVNTKHKYSSSDNKIKKEKNIYYYVFLFIFIIVIIFLLYCIKK